MLKTAKKITASNGNQPLPKASDFKLPKRLDAKTKKLIETGRAVMEELRIAREKRNQSET